MTLNEMGGHRRSRHGLDLAKRMYLTLECQPESSRSPTPVV